MAVCPAPRTVTTTKAKTNVTYTVTATDNCSPSPTITCTPPSGAAFPLGSNLVSCSAVDAAGNTGACNFTVTAQLPVPRATTAKVRQVFTLTLPFTLLKGTSRCRRGSVRAPASVAFTPASNDIQCTPHRPALDPSTCAVTVRCTSRSPGSFTVSAALVGTSDTSDPGQELTVVPRSTVRNRGRGSAWCRFCRQPAGTYCQVFGCLPQRVQLSTHKRPSTQCGCGGSCSKQTTLLAVLTSSMMPSTHAMCFVRDSAWKGTTC